MVLLAAYLLDPIKLELSTAKESASLLGSLASFAWPLVTLIILYLYREPLGKFLTTISARATEISIGSWASVKLPEGKEAPPDIVNMIFELKGDAPWSAKREASLLTDSLESDMPDFFGPSEIILVDLGDGNQWLTSRLFLLAVMFQRTTTLECIVFTRSLPSGDRRFVGCATPHNVRWALAANQPWLEVAYAFAYSQALAAVAEVGGTPPVTHIDGSLEPRIVQGIIQHFIYSIKDFNSVLVQNDPANWVQIGSGAEHATWLTETEVQRIVGVHLWRDAVQARSDDTPEQRKLEVKRVIGKSAPYVAILKDDAYKSLVNRIALLSEIGQSVA